MPATVSQPWLSARAASIRLGCSIYNVHKLAMTGRVRVKAEVGERVQYNAEDVERIAAERNPEASAPKRRKPRRRPQPATA